MRKDADYNVDAKVTMFFSTSDDYLANIIKEFADFFKHEALISDIQTTDTPD
jgi:hypothetical protein